MNILHILPQLNIGGVETATLDTVKYMAKSGHKVVVVSAGGELLEEITSCGALHYQLPVHEKSLITILKMISALAGIIKKEQISIVHAHSRVPAWIAYFASRRSNAAFITTCHGYYKKHIFSYVMGWGKKVIAISNVIARHMIDDFAVPHERIRLIPSGIDLEKFVPVTHKKKEKNFNVGIIGRLTPIKGHLYFIKAMAKVAKVIPNIKIWIVGDAPLSRVAYKEEIQVLARRLGLSEHTEFLGAQKNITEIIQQLDVLVLATVVPEAFGRVVIEAGACNIPVVATRVGGVVDIIEDGVNGILVAPADPDGMAQGIIRVLNNRDEAAVLAGNAYKKVQEEYSAQLMAERTLSAYKEALENSRILLIKFSSLGDIILSTAGLRAIREKFSSKITFLVGEESKSLLLRCPHIDELLVCDFKNKDKGFLGLLKLARVLRKKNFDIIIDLQNNRKSHILSVLSLCQNRYGYDNKKFGFLLNHRVKNDLTPMPPINHQFRILNMLGVELKDPFLELWPGEEDRLYVEELLSAQWLGQNQKVIGINISASPRWQTKSWPLENLIVLCQELGRRDMRVVITGTEKDYQAAETLMAAAKNVKIINTCGKTNINQLACLIKRCNIYLSPDSAPLHIAASVGTAFIAFFGPTDPARHMPPAKNYVLLKKDLPCAPCYKSKCKTKACMKLIRPEEVLGAINKLLK